MNNLANGARWGKVFFWPLLWIEAVVVTYLNWDATAMTGLLPYYENYARIVGSGFSGGAAAGGYPTFPMWGYGWVMLVLRSKIAIVIFQQLVAMLAVWVTLRIVKAEKLLSERSELVLRTVLLFSPGWFALHSVLWPNSIFASLLPISLLLLILATKRERGFVLFVLSGVLFGTLLNFRSDFLLLPLALAVLVAAFDRFQRSTMRKVGIWLAAAYLMLIPWATYTRLATGHVMLTSSNGGHVFFIGLGNLPGNKWKIQADDGDSVMRRVLEEQFGKPAPASVSIKADGYLKHQFFDRVTKDPSEYLRKMAYSGRSLVVKGAYAGELYETDECKPNCWTRLHNRGARVVADLPQQFSSSPGLAIHTFAFLASEAITRLLILLSYLLVPFTIWIAYRRRDLLAGIVVLTIGYHSLLSMAGYFMPAYSSMLILIFLLNLAIGGGWLLDRRINR